MAFHTSISLVHKTNHLSTERGTKSTCNIHLPLKFADDAADPLQMLSFKRDLRYF